MADQTAWVAEELSRLDEQLLRRDPPTLSSAPGPVVAIDGRLVVQLCSNDYLGLAGDPRLRAAAASAALRWGAGTGASRLVSGTNRLHRDLEASLARLKNREDAVLFSSGYLANVGTIAALAGKGDTVFSDELNHASLIDGCRLSGAQVAVYRHADLDHLAQLLDSVPAGRRLVVTDTVFSMDGDVAPLGGLAALCREHQAMLMLDDAHGTGLLDTTHDHGGVVMSTLSKALGAAGGFVAGTHDLVEFLRNRARSYMFDTAPAPAAVGAAAEGLRILGAEPERGQRALSSARRLGSALRELGYDVKPPAAAIIPVMVGGTGEALALAARLLGAGVLCPAIRPPSVPAGTARLRVTVTAAHTDEHVQTAIEAFARARRQAPAPAPLRPKPKHPNVDARILAAGGVFVTGTGTGVGKTVVAAALTRTLKAAGLRVAAMKPVQTGDVEGADDIGFIRQAADLPEELCATPYRLGAPLAPSVAARLEGGSIDPRQIRTAFDSLRRGADAVVAEGAGGLLVPVDGTTSMAGLGQLLGLPLVVVARPGLGTLNETALTVEAARLRGLTVLGIVLCGYPDDPSLAEATNPAEIERLTGLPISGVVPVLDGLDVDAMAVPDPFDAGAWLAPWLGGRFDRRGWLAGLAEELTGRADPRPEPVG